MLELPALGLLQWPGSPARVLSVSSTCPLLSLILFLFSQDLLSSAKWFCRPHHTPYWPKRAPTTIKQTKYN
ncbi:hypothetical protein ANANG_G00179400 [Anguilla anguilla]|uniref:Uncharacterized protein n=1 Tax=Anguilla anguilla TaxID=7936 RepID=A0A9D3M888_ANGAN|nr:hypothetical protein ANANG_G00179400 [Anguilla anguilla]